MAAHRGASAHHPENTLAAFRAARAANVAIQEFDVRELACGALVCMHDETFDRTTDSARVLGPGATVASTDLATARRLDTGTRTTTGAVEPVPTLAEALAVMLPTCVPLIEHKAGSAANYVRALRATGCGDQVVLQSFDWQFLAEVHLLAPEIALGALGPNPLFAQPDDAAIQRIRGIGVQLVHWRLSDLDAQRIERLHDAGMLVCSYTTDDAIGWQRGRDIGIDAMCTNDPGAMAAFLAT